jgi:subtilisin family serine protease
MRFTANGALTALGFALLAATSTHAARPAATVDGGGLITPMWTPVGLNTQSVNVVLQLSGDPVAVQQGNAGRKLSKGEKDQIKAQLKGAQDALRGSIASLGGTVVSQYQSAYNGIKVRIAANKVDQLAALPGVVAVRPLQLMQPDNTNGIPLIGAPGVWQTLGFHGEGVKVAVIDTGIDYTHANFNGPGTVAAYQAAHANETAPADPSLFGPAAPRVKGGTDLVGDDYDADPNSATYQPVPHPDPNPLDCNGHGSHVAGTAAGTGVLANGTTYTGTYDATTVSGNSWTIGPGVAPKADIYSIRVFGCNGSTDVTVDAIDWAVDHDMDVINMSLGSPFGSADDPSAQATTNAVKAGIVVATSAGNNGLNQYVVGSPSTADGAISVAAIDGTPSFPGSTITLPDGVITAINANGYAFAGPVTYSIKVIKDDTTTATRDESLGCSIADFGGPLPPNTIAVVNRGVCARVAKAIFGQQAGAAAVVMVNTDGTLPPFDGKITSNPDDGTPFVVTIPFLGVAGPPTPATTPGGKMRAEADGTPATVTPQLINNPNFEKFASFSSGGPRSGDSALKPDLSAPGVSVLSTASGTGNGGTIISGTSMSSPHVAGSAALTRQAHPTWSAQDIKAAMVNTGQPSMVVGYRTSSGGTGLVQPGKSTLSQVVARANDGSFTVSANFGYQELTGDFNGNKAIKLTNNGSTAANFNVAVANAAGRAHSVTFDKTSVSVPANGSATVTMTLQVPVATAGNADGAGLSFREVAGLVQFTPVSAADNAGVTLRVPYYLVPRAQSDISTTIGTLSGTDPSTSATVTNQHGAITASADFYAWGLQGQKVKGGKSTNDISAVGTQSFDWDGTQNLLVFAVNTYSRWSSPSSNEFDIGVDVDGDGTDDYIVVGVDQGAIQTGTFNGVMGTFVFSTRSAGASINFLATAPTDRSIAELAVLTSQLCRPGEPCLNAANPRISYHATGFDVINGGPGIDVPGVAKFNVFSSAVSQGGFVVVAPGGSDSSTPIAVNSAEFAVTPALGVMVVTLDNASGEPEAQLIDLKLKK